MFNSALRATLPLVRYQPARGMATLKDGVKSVKNLQENALSSKLALVAKYARTYAPELAPPTPAQIPAAIRDLRRLFHDWPNWTVRETWLNTLVATEVVCWFFVGECIGKGTLIGYQV
uniref:ATP synthase subunit g, mitochondrial n=1 Tax=Aceria tosichella TaxID=561515 RepID=A0A6G1S8K4_9ACAR